MVEYYAQKDGLPYRSKQSNQRQIVADDMR